MSKIRISAEAAVLYQILLQRTDENHKLTTDELRAALERCGITAERKSIYSDIEALQNFGLDVICQRGTGGGYYVASREFELPELKLLVDAIQCSRFITEKKSNELIGKIEHLTSDHEAHTLQRQVYVSERVKTLNEQIYYNIDALHAAISNDVQITFRYFNWVLNFSASPRIQKQYRRDGARYRVSPWALTWDNENYYLIASITMPVNPPHRVDKMDSRSRPTLPVKVNSCSTIGLTRQPLPQGVRHVLRRGEKP
ncbi:MAG: helix-turn-helix transcriptional regulator [Butyricicoccaceae bacterium]